MFLPNLDGDFVDVSGRRKNRSGGSGRERRTAAGLLTFGWWRSGSTARARCLFRSFVGRHFLKEGVWSWFWIQDCLDKACNCGEHIVGRIEKKVEETVPF